MISSSVHPKWIQDADGLDITHFSRYNFDEDKANCNDGLLVSIVQATEWDRYYKHRDAQYTGILSGLIKGLPVDTSKQNTHCRVQILREIRSNEFQALHSIPDVPKNRIIPWQP